MGRHDYPLSAIRVHEASREVRRGLEEVRTAFDWYRKHADEPEVDRVFGETLSVVETYRRLGPGTNTKGTT